MAFKVNEDILNSWQIELQDELSAVIKGLQIQEENKFRKRVLYHYTNISGLKGIIENQYLYLSNSAFLNDKEEFYYGLNLFRNIADKLLKKPTFKTNSSLIKKIVKELSTINKSNRYVTCFSFEGDLLSQWRAYSDDGKGISIGFDLQKMKGAFMSNAEGFLIVYDEKQQFKIASKILEKCIAFYSLKWPKHGSGSSKNFNEIISREIIGLIDQYIGQFKHSSFNEENEYRYEIKIDEDLKIALEVLFRVGKSGLFVPYLLLHTNYKDEKDRRLKEKKDTADLERSKLYKIRQLPIVEIIIGPSSEYELNKQSILDFLQKHNYYNVQLKRSNVPYRI